MTKIEIAKDFVSYHKNSDVTDWQPVGADDDSKWLTIYNNMMEGVYGESRKNDFGDMELEIGSHDSKSGSPVIYEWEVS